MTLEEKIKAWLDAFPEKKLWTVQELVRKRNPNALERAEVKRVMSDLGFTYVNQRATRTRMARVGWVRP